MNNATHNDNGTVTQYGFSCGYIESHHFEALDHGVSLSRENGCYFIKGYVPYKTTDIDFLLDDIWKGRHVHNSYRLLNDARKAFSKLKNTPDILIHP